MADRRVLKNGKIDIVESGPGQSIPPQATEVYDTAPIAGKIDRHREAGTRRAIAGIGSKFYGDPIVQGEIYFLISPGQFSTGVNGGTG